MARPQKTTVVIATRNRRQLLRTTLHRLIGLRPQPPLVVLDNASTDGTAELVRHGFPAVRLIRLARNTGASARTIGVLVAKTPYVAFSDDDSCWEQGALPLAEEMLDAHPRLGLLAATLLVGEEGRPDPVAKLMADSPLGRDPDLPGPSVLGFLACAAVVRRDAYLATGGFSPLLQIMSEEKLLSYDLAAGGWALCHVPQVRARHYPAATGRSATGRRTLAIRNDLLISWMRRPACVALRATASTAARALRRPEDRRALLAGLRLLPIALGERQRLPAHVERQARRLEAAQAH